MAENFRSDIKLESARQPDFRGLNALLGALFILSGILLTGPYAISVTHSQYFASCKSAKVQLIDERLWKGPQPQSALLPTKIGNFGSVHEGLQYLKGDAHDFLKLTAEGIKTLAETQRAYAQAAANCSKAPNSCSDEINKSIALDRQAVENEWNKMRLGLALGFPSFFCANRCIGYEPRIAHLFQWAEPFAKPSEFGEAPINADWDVSGALSQEEAQQAKTLLDQVTAPALKRRLSIWDYLAASLNPLTIQGVDGVRTLEAAMLLTRAGQNGEPSFRDRWKQNYFEAIRNAPLLLFVSSPKPTHQELAKAYQKVANNAEELLKGLASHYKMKAWDYFALTARDIVMTYHGVVENILQDPAHLKYCGIAERMMAEKLSNDRTKLAVQVGGTVATAVGCVLTGSSYVGLSLCAVSSLGITAKATQDARTGAEQARLKAGSSASPTLLVDDYEALSTVDQDAVTAEMLKYFALIDVAALGTMATKMSIKGYQFLVRMEQFSKEIALHQNAASEAVRKALREALSGSPSIVVAKKAAHLFSLLPRGVLTTDNAADIGKSAKAIAMMAADNELPHWAKVITAVSEGGNPGTAGLSLVLEKALQNFVLGKPRMMEALAKSLDQEIARIQVDGDELATVAKKNEWLKSARLCMEEAGSNCGEDFARIGRTAFNSEADQLSLEAIAKAGQLALGRKLSDKESQAIFAARRLGSIEAYTPDEVMQQNQLLNKAGLKQNEIDQLRRKALIGNWVKNTASSTPGGTQTIHSSWAIDRQIVEQLKAGKSFYYFIDDMDQLKVTDQAFDLSGQSILMARAISPSGDLQALRVKEAGELVFNLQSKKMEFQAKYGFPTEGKHASQMNPITRDSTIRLSPNLQQTKVLSCLDILQARQAGKGFVLNNMVADNMVLTGAIIGSELLGAGRLKDQEGREVIMTDYIASNVSSTLNSILRKKLTLSKANFLSYSSSRLSTNFLLIELQREIFRANLTHNGDERADAIRNFNLGWTVARLPTNYYFDRYIMNTLPLQLYSSCSQGGKAMKVLMHPRMIAIYEKTFFSVLYFEGRQLIVNE